MEQFEAVEVGEGKEKRSQFCIIKVNENLDLTSGEGLTLGLKVITRPQVAWIDRKETKTKDVIYKHEEVRQRFLMLTF